MGTQWPHTILQICLHQKFWTTTNYICFTSFGLDTNNDKDEDDIIKTLACLVDNIFLVFAGDSRYSNGNKLCPSSSRHISLLIWSRIHTVFTLKGISVRFHIHLYRRCFIHKQPEVWELTRLDVSCWIWDRRHEREQHNSFLSELTSVNREGLSTSHFHFWQTWRFQFPYPKFSVPD